jgi:hypothetical protein
MMLISKEVRRREESQLAGQPVDFDGAVMFSQSLTKSGLADKDMLLFSLQYPLQLSEKTIFVDLILSSPRNHFPASAKCDGKWQAQETI